MRQINMTLCWDQDDTLVPTAEPLYLFFEEKTGIRADRGHHDKFSETFGISNEQIYEYFIEFAKKDVLKDVPPFPGMFDLLLEMKNRGCINIITTARPRASYEQQTWNYLNKFFPGIFHFNNLLMHSEPTELNLKVDKISMVKQVNGDMFIDDSPEKVIEMNQVFPEKLILFKEHHLHPLIDPRTLPEGIVPVKTAFDIKKAIFKFHTKRNNTLA